MSHNSSSGRPEYQEHQIKRNQIIKNYGFQRLGYPPTGVIEGYFENGRFHRTDGPRPNKHLGKPLVDLTYLDILPNGLAHTYLNNAGTIFQESQTCQVDHKEPERNCIKLLSSFFGSNPDEIDGYITSGSTEGDMFAIKKARDFCSRGLQKVQNELDVKCMSIEKELSRTIETKDWCQAFMLQQELFQLREKKQRAGRSILYASDRAHYCIDKIADYLGIHLIKIKSEKNGQINLDDFSQKMKDHRLNNQSMCAICVATLGTTQEGVCDDVEEMRRILKEEVEEKSGVGCIIIDAAIYGPFLPLMKSFEGKNLFNYGVAIVLSGHKLFGTFLVSGAVLLKKSFSGSDNPTFIEYTKLSDFTLSGSRSGLHSLEFECALNEFELPKFVSRSETPENPSKIRQLFVTCQENLQFLYDALCSVLGEDNVLHQNGSFVVNFCLPFRSESCQFLVKEYGLMPVKIGLMDKENCFAIHGKPSVDKWLIDKFVTELKVFKEKEVCQKPNEAKRCGLNAGALEAEQSQHFSGMAEPQAETASH